MIALLIGLMVAAAPAPLQVRGDVAKPGSFTIAQLEALAPSKATWANHGSSHEVWGVPLEKLLAAVGVEAGPMSSDTPKEKKRSGYRKVVVATAADGFQAVFSSAEVFSAMGPTQAWVVWKIDGKPLPDDVGPVRLAVMTDKEGSRSLRQLVRLDVVDGAKVAAP